MTKHHKSSIISVAENYLAQSSNFSDAVWDDPTSNSSVVGNNATAPDGSLTADTVTANGNGIIIRQSMLNTLDSTEYTVCGWIRLVSGNGNLNFDLHDGVNSSNITATSTWQYFCETITSGTNSDFLDINKTGGPGVFNFWNFQVNRGDIPHPYVRTTTEQEVHQEIYQLINKLLGI